MFSASKRGRRLLQSHGSDLKPVTIDLLPLFPIGFMRQMEWTAPTLADMAALIDRSRSQPDDIANPSIVYPMVKKGTGRPLFFNGANTRLTRDGAWSPDIPIYGMSQWAHGAGFIKAETIEELAARQIAEIRQIQPKGPYRVAGFSLGGLIALEIAQQLRAGGHEVELHFLLDPMMPVRFQLGEGDAIKAEPGYVRRPLRVRVGVTARTPPTSGRPYWVSPGRTGSWTFVAGDQTGLLALSGLLARSRQIGTKLRCKTI